MATLSVFCLIVCLYVVFAGITEIYETRYVRAGTDETLSCLMNRTVQSAFWTYSESFKKYPGDYIFIASKSVPYKAYPRKDRIAVEYDTDNGVYNVTLLNFNGQTDVGMYTCNIVLPNSEYFHYFFTVEFADGPSTATITGNVPVFADDSSSLTLTCAATAKPGVTFQWQNGTNIIGYSNNLTLSPAREDNGVAITCTAMNREYDYIRASDSVTLEVHYGPKSVTITGDPVYADGTNRLTLTCTAEEYNPDVGFQWKEGNQNINGENTNTYTKIADKTDNGRTLTCLTWNTMHTNTRKETSTQLIVYYGPDNADILGTSTVYADGVNTLTFTCTSADSYPGVRFQWTKGGTSIGDNSDTLAFTPVPTDHGKDVVCIVTNTAHQNGQARDNVILTVYYGPKSVTITGGPVYADSTNTLTLTCTAEEYNPDVGFQWKEGNQNINGENTNTYTKIADKTDNGRTLTCLTWNTMYTNKRKETSRKLTVYYGPKSVTITGGPVYADGTSTLTLTCTAEEYNPDVGFQWKEGNQNINGQNTNTYTKIADTTDNGRTLTCLTWNTMHTNKRKETSRQLTVYYGAHNTDILISVLKPREGDDVTVVCTCDSNPAPSFAISGPTGEIHSQSRLHIENIFRADSGTYTCTAGNEYGTQTKAIVIIVNYAPEITVTAPLVVSEGERGVEILCEAHGIPNSYNFGKWQHLGPTDKIEVRKLDGKHTGNKYVLVLDKPLTYEDSGYYECNVNNGVFDQTEKVDQSDRKYLQVTGVPTFLEDKHTTYGEIGQNVKVEVSFYSVPEYTDVTWFTLSSSGQQNVADRSLNIEQTIDQRILDTTYHGVDVTVNGYIAALLFKNMTVENTGSYVVVIANEKGQTSYVINLDITTETDDLKTEETTVIPIAGAVAGSVGVLLIVIVLVFIVLCRRGVITKPLSSCLKDNPSSETDVYQNQAFDPESAEGSSTNEAIYQEIGPSKNPAMHYESLTQSDIATVHKTS